MALFWSETYNYALSRNEKRGRRNEITSTQFSPLSSNHTSQFSVLNSQFSVLNFQSSIFNLQSSWCGGCGRCYPIFAKEHKRVGSAVHSGEAGFSRQKAKEDTEATIDQRLPCLGFDATGRNACGSQENALPLPANSQTSTKSGRESSYLAAVANNRYTHQRAAH